MGAVRFIEEGGKRLAQHDGRGNALDPRWEDVYALEDFDGALTARCRIVVRADGWEVGVTEGDRILLGTGEGRVYSMTRDEARKVLAVLETVLEGNGP